MQSRLSTCTPHGATCMRLEAGAVVRAEVYGSQGLQLGAGCTNSDWLVHAGAKWSPAGAAVSVAPALWRCGMLLCALCVTAVTSTRRMLFTIWRWEL